MEKRTPTLISALARPFRRVASYCSALIADGFGHELVLPSSPTTPFRGTAPSMDQGSWEYTNPYMSCQDAQLFEKLQQLHYGWPIRIYTVTPSSLDVNSDIGDA